jgi:single-strand DNA-binding protein
MLKLQVIGHLGKDCISNVVNGKNVINFSVAHSEKFKDSAGIQKEKTLWVECAYWTDRIAIAPYLKKGQLIYADGIPDQRSYTKNDGTQGIALTLRVLNIQLLGSSSKNENGESTSGSNNENPVLIAVGSDDLPF